MLADVGRRLLRNKLVQSVTIVRDVARDFQALRQPPCQSKEEGGLPCSTSYHHKNLNSLRQTHTYLALEVTTKSPAAILATLNSQAQQQSYPSISISEIYLYSEPNFNL